MRLVSDMTDFLDWNSLISACIGGVIALLGAIITMRVTRREREKQDSRELVPLFYFLNSKAVLLVKLGKNPKKVSITKIVTEGEISDVRSRLSYATRALTLSEIGEINSFCNQLIVLEETRKDCYEASPEMYSMRIALYQAVLQQCLPLLSDEKSAKGINTIGEKLEEYFSQKLSESYR